jgi:hypothetical protein
MHAGLRAHTGGPFPNGCSTSVVHMAAIAFVKNAIARERRCDLGMRNKVRVSKNCSAVEQATASSVPVASDEEFDLDTFAGTPTAQEDRSGTNGIGLHARTRLLDHDIPKS